MLFLTFLLQSLSIVALLAAMFVVERLLHLVPHPRHSWLVSGSFLLFIVSTLFVIGVNDGKVNGLVDGEGAVSVLVFTGTFFHWSATILLLVFSIALRRYVRVRALSRISTTAPTPTPTPAAPEPAAHVSEEAGEPQIVCNSDMEVVELNQGAARLLQRDVTEVAGKSITRLVRKEEMLLVPELFRQVKAGEAQGGEWSFRLPDETLVPVRISVRQHTGDQIRLILRDLTEETDTDSTAPAAAAAPPAGNDPLIISLLDASADGYVAFDPDLKIVAWNARMEKLTGIMRDQCLNQHLLMHFPVPEELAEEDYFLESLEGHTNEIANASIINPNTNETHVVDHHFAPLFNPTGEIIGGMVIVRKPLPAIAGGDEPAPAEEATPITFDLPAAEPGSEAMPAMPAEAESASGLLESTFAAAAHIVAVFDLETETELYANRSLPEELGFNAAQIAELGDQPLNEIVHPEDQPNLPRTAADWNDGSGISRRVTEFRAIDPERQWHWFQSADTVLERSADGNICKIVAVIQDITESKEGERRLRQAEQRYRTFSEHCPTGIWHLKPGGKTDYLNPAMCRILGLGSPDEIADRSYHDFITPDSQLNIATQVAPAPGEIPTVEIEIQRPDGSLRKCLLHGQPELDEAGQICSLMGSFVDLTDRAEAAPTAGVDEETLAALQQELEEARAGLRSTESDRDEANSALQLARTELEATRATMQELESARDAALELAENSSSRIGELESELEKVRGELEESRTVQLNVETTRSALATAESERDESKHLLAELNSELDETRTDLETANAALTEAQNAREEDAQALSELREELTLTKNFLEAAGAEQEQAKEAAGKAQGELQNLQARFDELAQSRDESRTELESAKSARAEAEKSRDEANQSLAETKTELETMKSRVAEAEKSRGEANQRITDAEAGLETARTALAEAEKSRDEANHYLGETRAELEATQSALAEAEQARDEARQALDATRAELEASKSAVSDAEQSRDDARKALAEAREEHEATQSALAAAEASLAQAKTENEQTFALLAEAETERDQANQSLNDALAERDQLKTELADEKATREEADQALAEVNAELKEALTAKAKSTAASEELRAELDAAKKALHDTETVHLEVKTSQDKTSAALAAAQAALAAAEASRDETAGKLEQSQTAAKEFHAQLGQTTMDLEQTKAQLAEAKAQVQAGVKALETANESKHEVTQQLHQLQADFDDVKASREQADQSLAELRSAHDELHDKLAATSRELEQTRTQLTEAHQSLEQAKGGKDKEVARLNEELEQAQEERQQLQTHLDEATAAREKAESALARNQEGFTELRDSQQQLVEANTALTEQNQSLESRLAEQTKALEEAQQANEGTTELQQALAETKAALTAAESARRESEEKLDRANSELASARAKLAEAESSLGENETALDLAEAAIAELESKYEEAQDAMREADRRCQERQDAVTESERKFANLQYHLTGIAYRQKPDDARPVEFVSVGCAAFTGHAPEQFTAGNKSLLSLVHPDDRDAVVNAMNEAARAGRGYEVDYRLLHDDGTERRVSDRGCGVFNPEQELIAFEGVITEVVERKSGGDLAETALHTLPAGIWITNAEGRTTYHNETWTEITGFESGNGLDWSEAVHGEDRGRVVRTFKDAASRHEACEAVFRVRQRDGQSCWMRLIATPRRDARERFTGYLGTCFDITENIHAVEELKAGQRQMEWAQTRAKLGSWEYHPSTNVRRWSKQTSLLYNLKPGQELPGSFEEFLELVHEDDRAKIAATNDNVLKSGRPAGNLEFRTNPAKGPLRHLTATVYRVPEEDGSAYYLAGTVMDISDQKVAEENVRRSEERYRKIIEVAEEGVWMMDAEGYTSFVNPRMMQMLGYRYREFIGRHFFEFLASESTTEAEEYMERRQKGISEQAEFVFLRKDGKPVNVLINSSSLKDADGDFIGILSLVSDITARKAANAEAEKEQQQIRTVLATAPDFILSVDQTKIVRFINRDYAGMKPEQIVGTPALNWVTPDHRERYDEALQNAFATGAPQDFEMNGLGPDNSTATYRTRIRPVSEGDQVQSLIVVSQDITGQAPPAPAGQDTQPSDAPADDRLQTFSRRLLTSQENELRSLADLLHDEFGQSLSAAKLTLQTLAGTEEDAKNKQRIEGSVESLDKLIVRTRELSQDLRSPILDDLGLFPALRGLVTAKADSTGIAVEFAGEDLGRLDPEIETAAFRVAEQALANIVQHAKAKAASVSLKQVGNQLQLTISDNGKGFDLKRARSGNTAGLILMEKRVTLVGGEFTIDSGRNKGTTVEISLPLSPAPQAAKAQSKPKTKRKSRKKSK